MAMFLKILSMLPFHLDGNKEAVTYKLHVITRVGVFDNLTVEAANQSEAWKKAAVMIRTMNDKMRPNYLPDWMNYSYYKLVAVERNDGQPEEYRSDSSLDMNPIRQPVARRRQEPLIERLIDKLPVPVGVKAMVMLICGLLLWGAFFLLLGGIDKLVRWMLSN